MSTSTNQPNTPAVPAAITEHIDAILLHTDPKPGREADLRLELEDHLLTKVDALTEQGLSHADAVHQAVKDHGDPTRIGYALRPWRFIDVRSKGTARGWIAVGPKAVGGIAIGGVATGFVAFGGVAIGAISYGGVSLALLLAWGGLAIAPIAAGAVALGLVAAGGLAIGAHAFGGLAMGWAAGGGHAVLFENAPAWVQRLSGIADVTRTIMQRPLLSQSINLIWLATMLVPLFFLNRKEHKRLRAAARFA